MTQSILRLAHRKTVEESDSIDRIIELLFKDDDDNIDYNLSLYLLDASSISVTRIIAEHSAFSEIDPPARAAINLASFFDQLLLIKDDDGGYFHLRRDSHFVLHISRESEGDGRQIYESIASFLISDKNDRFWSASASQIKEYGRREYNISNDEWVNSANSCSTVMEWVCKSLDPSIKTHRQKLDPDFVKAKLH